MNHISHKISNIDRFNNKFYVLFEQNITNPFSSIIYYFSFTNNITPINMIIIPVIVHKDNNDKINVINPKGTNTLYDMM